MTIHVDDNKWTRELAEHAVWDPDDPSLEPNVYYNNTKIKKLAAKFLDAFLPVAIVDQIDTAGTTTTEIAKMNPGANCILLITGVVTPTEFVGSFLDNVALYQAGKELCPIVVKDPKVFLETIKETQRGLQALSKVTTSVKVGKLGELKLPDGASRTAIDTLLNDAKLPKLEDIFKQFENLADTAKVAKTEADQWSDAHKQRLKELEALKGQVADLMARASTAVTTEYTSERGEIPDGKVVAKKVKDVFPMVTFEGTFGDMQISTWEWDGDHPDVPAVDASYIFREKHLRRALYAIMTNQREYIQGHTGSGKTTLVEQVAAHLKWPFIRINFDSEITRMDLIGRDTLVSDAEGKVTSKFEDGMLPTAMSGPYICCFDELDFVRPDVAYVMQAALEGNGLRITEDGDRMVKPHPMFRMFGTGNTVGQGDEDGMYQGARPQSLAFLDRFTVWDKVEYLAFHEREDLVKNRYPSLDPAELNSIMLYTTEHLEAFTQGKVIQPISPRGMLAVANATVMLGSVKEALMMCVIDRANKDDRATLLGLVDRIVR